MSDGPTNQGQVGTKSRTSRSRGPLRVTDHNADISMSILSEGSNAIDLDETSVHSRKKKVQRLTNGLPTTEHLNASPAAGTKGRRRRQCYVTDEQNVIPESPVMMRELRSRRVV
jgi:hypothetical protein